MKKYSRGILGNLPRAKPGFGVQVGLLRQEIRDNQWDLNMAIIRGDQEKVKVSRDKDEVLQSKLLQMVTLPKQTGEQDA